MIIEKIPDNIKLKADMVAELLEVKPKTVRKWVNENKLRSCNPGGHHRILGKDLKEFLLNREQKQQRTRMKLGSLFKNITEESFENWLFKAKMTGEVRYLPTVFNEIIENKIYRTNDVAKLLGITPASVRTYVSQKGLRSLNHGGHHVIMGKDLKEFLFKRITN